MSTIASLLSIAGLFLIFMTLFIGSTELDRPTDKKLRLSRRQIELQRSRAIKEGYALNLEDYLEGTESYSKEEMTSWGQRYKKEINI